MKNLYKLITLKFFGYALTDEEIYNLLEHKRSLRIYSSYEKSIEAIKNYLKSKKVDESKIEKIDESKIEIEAEKMFFSIIISEKIGTIQKCFSEETINNTDDPVKRLFDSTYETYQSILDEFANNLKSKRQSSITALCITRTKNAAAIASTNLKPSAQLPDAFNLSSRPSGGQDISDE